MRRPVTLSRCANILRIQSMALADRAATRLPERDRFTQYLGYRFSYPSRSQIGRMVSKGVVWDEPLRDMVARLPRNELVCDIGANLGASLFTMCRARHDIRFMCFEASPRYISYLLENVRSNCLEGRVEVVHSLIGPDATRWTLSSDVTTGSVARENGLRARLLSTEEMESTSLDSWFASRPPPALLKVDTDGFELQVLSSGSRMLRGRRPTLFIEFCPSLLAEVGDSAQELLAFLLDHGYTTATLYSPTGVSLQQEVPLAQVNTGPHVYIDLAIPGEATAG